LEGGREGYNAPREVYDNREVLTTLHELLPRAGLHSLSWNGRSNISARLPGSGKLGNRFLLQDYVGCETAISTKEALIDELPIRAIWHRENSSWRCRDRKLA
jgi:hypothetical protein